MKYLLCCCHSIICHEKGHCGTGRRNQIQYLRIHAKFILVDKVEDGIKISVPYKITPLLTDWCKHGIRFILLQKHCRCPPKPSGGINTLCCREGRKGVIVQSRFTIPAEGKYAPTEGEALGVSNELEKSEYFTLVSLNLYICTGHKPLLGLLGDKPLEKIDNPRLVQLLEKPLGSLKYCTSWENCQAGLMPYLDMVYAMRILVQRRLIQIFVRT